MRNFLSAAILFLALSSQGRDLSYICQGRNGVNLESVRMEIYLSNWTGTGYSHRDLYIESPSERVKFDLHQTTLPGCSVKDSINKLVIEEIDTIRVTYTRGCGNKLKYDIQGSCILKE